MTLTQEQNAIYFSCWKLLKPAADRLDKLCGRAGRDGQVEQSTGTNARHDPAGPLLSFEAQDEDGRLLSRP